MFINKAPDDLNNISGKNEHGRLTAAVILAVIGVACGMRHTSRRQKSLFC